MDTSTLAYDYKITTIPTIIIFDKEGKIASRHEGITDNQILIDEIVNLIKEG